MATERRRAERAFFGRDIGREHKGPTVEQMAGVQRPVWWIEGVTNLTWTDWGENWLDTSGGQVIAYYKDRRTFGTSLRRHYVQ